MKTQNKSKLENLISIKSSEININEAKIKNKIKRLQNAKDNLAAILELKKRYPDLESISDCRIDTDFYSKLAGINCKKVRFIFNGGHIVCDFYFREKVTIGDKNYYKSIFYSEKTFLTISPRADFSSVEYHFKPNLLDLPKAVNNSICKVFEKEFKKFILKGVKSGWFNSHYSKYDLSTLPPNIKNLLPII